MVKWEQMNSPQIINLWFEGCPSDAMLTNLDLAGIAAAAGSACTAGSLEPSHVLAKQCMVKIRHGSVSHCDLALAGIIRLLRSMNWSLN